MYICVQLNKLTSKQIQNFINLDLPLSSMPDDKKKISVILSMDFIRKIEDSGLGQTEAITRGLDIFFSEDYKQIKSAQKQIQSDKEKILVLEAKLIEIEKHNETLKKELEKTGRDKEAIQNLYNNYMLQMQTLINQRSLEPPAAEKVKPWWKFW